MRKMLIKYRVKLSSILTLQNVLYSLLEGKYKEEEIDLQILDYNLGLIKDFSNSHLDVTNSYEGYASFIFYGNFALEKLTNLFLSECTNSFDVLLNNDMLFTYEVNQYVIYQKNLTNAFYIVKNDFTPLDKEFLLNIENIWQAFTYIYTIINQYINFTAPISSMVISQDGKMCKIITSNLNYQQFLDVEEDKKLNRILPS